MVVCYIERAAGGSLVRRVRLMSAGSGNALVDRTWNAPALTSSGAGAGAGGGSGAETGATEAVSATRAAARWVIENLAQLGTRSIDCICLDPDGSLCTWLSSPSADPAVITATLMQPDADDGSGTGGSAARLLALGAASSSGFSPGDASVQALATLEPPGKGGMGGGLLRSRRTALGRTAGSASIDGYRERYAVMAVPDAPVRVFLDELDARGIDVQRVISLWHAMAAAWDPGAERGSIDDGERVVASVSPASAIILVDPLGRLVWSWAQAGQLVAGGAMRLKTVRRRAAGDETDDHGMAKRIGSTTSAGADAAEQLVVEFTEADAGRLVVDWLSWSAQLGHCPQRVACIGPAPAADASTGSPDPALIGQTLGAAWPGATIGVGVHADPIGATLQRMVTMADRADSDNADDSARERGVAVGSDDPRSALVGLSSRAGRADRSLYTWMAIGVAAAALSVGAIGWQLYGAGAGADTAIANITKARKESLESMNDVIKDIALLRANEARDSLMTKSDELRKQIAAIKPPRPFLAELARVFKSMEDHDGVKINSISLGPVTGAIDMVIPEGQTGPAIVQNLVTMDGVLIKWQGNVRGVTNIDGPRNYVISGSLILDDTRPGGGK